MAPSKSPDTCSPVATKCLPEHLPVEIQLDCRHLAGTAIFSARWPWHTLQTLWDRVKKAEHAMPAKMSRLFLIFILQCFTYYHIYGVYKREHTEWVQRPGGHIFGVSSLLSALRGLQKLNSGHQGFEVSASTHWAMLLAPRLFLDWHWTHE